MLDALEAAGFRPAGEPIDDCVDRSDLDVLARDEKVEVASTIGTSLVESRPSPCAETAHIIHSRQLPRLAAVLGHFEASSERVAAKIPVRPTLQSTVLIAPVVSFPASDTGK